MVWDKEHLSALVLPAGPFREACWMCLYKPAHLRNPRVWGQQSVTQEDLLV